MKIKGIIIEQERKDETIINKLKSDNHPIYIYGCGNNGIALYNFLKENGICAKSFIVDDEFYSFSNYKGIPVQRTSEIEKTSVMVNLVIGFADFALGISKGKKLRNVKDLFCISNPHLYLNEFELDWSFLKNNMIKFEHTYDLLEDELSKKIMVAYLNTRINRNYEFLMPYGGCKTYFNSEIVNLSDKEFYIDCGAFNGDSIKNFINSVNGKYQKIYAIEPDKMSFNEMRERLLDEDNLKICMINKGVWNKKDKLGFHKKGDQELTIADEMKEDQEFIEVDSLDNIIGENQVSLIKFSVQGSEKEALEGAKNILKNYAPTMAITIFMRPDALITIPQMIKRINPNYKLYLRCEEPFFARVILYAKRG